jgi:hypothetical protein
MQLFPEDRKEDSKGNKLAFQFHAVGLYSYGFLIHPL